MTISHLLEDFGAESKPEEPAKLMSEDELEDIRLGAFEQGYSAGWEDATSAQDKDRTRISAALAGNLEDISFTYHEAVNQMTQSLEPVFGTLIHTFLPQTMARTFGNHILEQLLDMARTQAEGPVQLLVPVGSGSAVKGLISKEMSLPIKVLEVATLDEGQASLRVGASEREIDFGALLETFSDAVDAFFYQTNKEANHG